MYVLVHHTIHDPDRYWGTVQEATPKIPPALKLHQCIPARDGSRATCLWEAESIESVETFIEPLLGDVSTNEYFDAENREGIAMPSKVAV